MIKKVNVLIFPASGENALNLYRSLRYNIHFNVFGVSAVKSHVSLVYPPDKYHESDAYFYKKTNFIDNFNKTLRDFNIKYILPTLDDISVFLTENQDKLVADVVCSPAKTTAIAYEKRATYETFKNDYFSPEIFETPADIKNFPVFVKPNIGAGSKGTFVAENPDKLKHIRSDDIVMEYLPGTEYTVDCFTNRHGELLFSGARTREEIRNGITWCSEFVQDDEEFRKIAEAINKKLVFRGLWFFQVKRAADNSLKLMEISVRAAGTMTYFRQLGINFASLALFDAMGHDVKILFNNIPMRLSRCIQDNFVLNYQYDTVYFDLDDTLIINGMINIDAIRFLYQSVNAKKKLCLLAKHEYEVNETLSKYRISPSIFDEIIHISGDLQKCDCITDKKAIFIDNYFPDRAAVHEKCGIPVFDVDAIQCLLSERGF